MNARGGRAAELYKNSGKRLPAESETAGAFQIPVIRGEGVQQKTEDGQREDAGKLADQNGSTSRVCMAGKREPLICGHRIESRRPC